MNEWVIFAGWEWKGTSASWIYEVPATCSNVKLGGDDAAGLWFETTTGLQLTYYTLDTWDNKGTKRIATTIADDWNQNGVAFVEPDTVFMSSCFDPMKYDWHKGSLKAWWAPTGAQHGTSAVKFRLGHTWSSTGVTDATVGLSDVSITFSKTTEQWNGTSSPFYWSY